ncbi:MAG: hypothetical protein AAFX87_20355 [Bacteroidota bacterium]
MVLISHTKRIKYLWPVSLLWFTGFFAITAHGQSQVSLEYIDEKPVSVSIPLDLFHDYSDQEKTDSVQVVLKGQSTPIAGQFTSREGYLVFKPLWSFTPDLSYEVIHHGNLIATFRPRPSLSLSATKLTGLYPSQDTLPANLLKVYLEFSAPMQEGKSTKYVMLMDANSDTLHDSFLPLKPELWNHDRTRLTLWLDPGRIKRELGPNLHDGSPLEKGKQYHLHVSSQWKDANGQPLVDQYDRTIYVSAADRQHPFTTQWQLSKPKVATSEVLQIDFGESLDYVLANYCLQIKRNGEMLPGQIALQNEERMWQFQPHELWQRGEYIIEVQSRIEDLAGNNLNRVFDRDLEVDPQEPENQEIQYLKFVVE